MAGKAEWFSTLAFYLLRPQGPCFGPDKAALHLWSSIKWHSAGLRRPLAESFTAWEHCIETCKKIFFPVMAANWYSAKCWIENSLDFYSGTTSCTLIPASGHRQSIWGWIRLSLVGTGHVRGPRCSLISVWHSACHLLPWLHLQPWAMPASPEQPSRTVAAFYYFVPP